MALQPEQTDRDTVPIGEAVRSIEARRERLVDLYVGGDLDKTSCRRRSEELDAEFHAAESAFADRLAQKTLVRIPTTYEALEELWDKKGIEFQRLLIEAVLEPITVKQRSCGVQDHSTRPDWGWSQGVSANNTRSLYLR